MTVNNCYQNFCTLQMDPYDNVVGGRLKLRKKVKKVCKSELQNDSGTTLQRTTGSGRIVSSGNTVQG